MCPFGQGETRAALDESRGEHGLQASAHLAQRNHSSACLPNFMLLRGYVAGFFLVVHWVTPLICLVVNEFAWKRRLRWLPLFMTSCTITYLALMLVAASHILKDAFARRGIDASLVFGQGDASDAGLALAPVLGIPVAVVWNSVNFAAFGLITFCVRLVFPKESESTRATKGPLR